MVCQGRLDILPFLTLTYSLWGLRKSLAESKLKLTMQQISKNITFHMDFRLSTMNFKKKFWIGLRKKNFAISLKNYFFWKVWLKLKQQFICFSKMEGRNNVLYLGWLALMRRCKLAFYFVFFWFYILPKFIHQYESIINQQQY